MTDATDLDQHERDVLANMVMRSLRGSWAPPFRERAEFLISLADAGLSDYDNNSVRSRAESFINGGESGYRDGRTFRYIYQDGPNLSEQTDEKTAKALVGHIPAGDLTWDANAIERKFSDD